MLKHSMEACEQKYANRCSHFKDVAIDCAVASLDFVSRKQVVGLLTLSLGGATLL